VLYFAPAVSNTIDSGSEDRPGGATAEVAESGPRRRRYRLRAADRVRKATEFRRAYRDGVRAQDGLVRVVVARNFVGRVRIGLSVSRRRAGKAHCRNRLKRLYREAFRLERAELPPALDVIVMPGDGEEALRPALEDLRRSFRELIARAATDVAKRRGGGGRRRGRPGGGRGAQMNKGKKKGERKGGGRSGGGK